jgi:microcystin-dependent protein
MSEPFLGEIRIFAGNFAPQGWAMCNGQIMSISQNTALFSLLGTTYGGNGQSTFALPDLRGRVVMHMGSGPGLSSYTEGQVGGNESVAITVNQMPAHGHTPQCTNNTADSSSPGGGVWATDGAGVTGEYSTGAPNAPMNPAAIGPTGSNQAHENRQPFLVINYIIALQGIFPARN